MIESNQNSKELSVNKEIQVLWILMFNDFQLVMRIKKYKNDFSIKLHNQSVAVDDKQISQASTISIISEALTERKTDNFTQISNYMSKHIEQCIPHMNVLIQIQGQINIKVANTKVTVRSIIEYLSELKVCYQNWKLHMTALSKKEPKLNQDLGYPQIKSALKSLFNVPTSLVDSADSFCNYIKNQCLTEIEDSLDMYLKSLECFLEQIASLKREADKYLRLMYKKFVIIQILMTRGTTKGYDIVFEQLNFIQYCNEANRIIKQWGKMVNYYWKSAQKSQMYLMKTLKIQIINCFKNIQKINFTFPKYESILATWENVRPQEDIIEAYSLSLLTSKECQNFINIHTSQKLFVQTCKFQQFISMQDFLSKNVDFNIVISKLILKRFYCNLQISSQANCSPIQILSTIDGCIVFIIPPFKGYTKMQIMSITFDRIDSCTISITQKRKGIIKTSWNRQVVKFKNEDQADQFQAFLAPTEEERNSILI